MKLLARLLAATTFVLVTCCHGPRAKLNPPVNAEASPAVISSNPPSRSQRLDHGTFAITVPSEWSTEDPVTIEGAGSELRLVARSDVSFADGPIVVTVEVIDISDDMADEAFGDTVLQVLKMNDVKTIVEGRVLVDAKPGSIAVMLLDGNVSVVQYAVGHNGNGYLVRCAGDIKAARTVAPACRKVLDTFHLNEVI